jgi:nicotinate phosphoribosyltransferase
MIVNFAERAHNHNWELDPVTRSLLDTDFYKLLMLQFIWRHYRKTQVSFSLAQPHLFRAPGGHVSARRDSRTRLEHVRKLHFQAVGTGVARRQHFLRPPRNL